MSTTKPTTLSLIDLLDRVVLTDVERIRAEAAMLRGEFLADLMLRAVKAIGSAIRGIKMSLRPKAPRHLGPTV